MFKFLIRYTTTLCLLSAPLYAMITEERDKDSAPSTSVAGRTNLLEHTEMEIDKPSQAGPVVGIPIDLLKLILAKASKDILPIHLTPVCKSWYTTIYEKQHLQPPIQIFNLNSFMKECIGIWGEERFKHRVLKYKAGSSEELSLKFSDTEDGWKGTVDLSSIADAKKISAITSDMERFFRVDQGADYEGKVVVLFVQRQEVEKNIQSIAKHFAPIMDKWNGAYPVGMFWRSNVRKDLNRYDYLVNASLSSIASRNLLENWNQSSTHGSRTASSSLGERPRWHGVTEGKNFHVCFGNKN